MKKFIDENIKANQEAVIRENNGPEIVLKMTDNNVLNWLYHYEKSNSSSLVLIDDSILKTLIKKSNSYEMVRNASSKIYDIRLKNAVNNNSLNLIVKTTGLYRLGDDMNTNIVLGINDKIFNQEKVSENYFVLLAQNKMKRETKEGVIDLRDGKPLNFLRKNITQLNCDDALILFSSSSMRKAFGEDVETTAKLIDGSETNNIRKIKKEDIESVRFVDKQHKNIYTFLKSEEDNYWILNSVQSYYAGKDKELYKIENVDFMTPTLINCVENFFEKEQ